MAATKAELKNLDKKVKIAIFRALEFCGPDLNKLAQKTGDRQLVEDVATDAIAELANAREIVRDLMDRT